MTASPERRRRSTIVGAVAAVAGMAVIAVTAAFGALTLADSQAGRDAGAGLLEIALPETATGLMVAIDADGAPASLAVVVLSPDGRGGSVVPVPVSAAEAEADLALRIEDVLPLSETWQVLGPEEFAVQASEVLGVVFDVIEVVDAEELSALLGRFGTIEIEVPPLGDDEAALVALEPGERVSLDATAAASLLTTSRAEAADRDLIGLGDVIWNAYAEQIGPGLGAPDESAAEPVSLESLMDRLAAGPLGVRSPRFSVPARAENPRQVDAVLLDGAELLLIFGQIAPARVTAPNPSFNFRVESNFSAEQLAPYGVNNADIAREVIEVLLFLQSNVISVQTSDSGAPSATVGLVARDAPVETLAESWSLVFGDIELEPTNEVIAQVDVTVVLGEDYLEFREQRLGQDRQ